MSTIIYNANDMAKVGCNDCKGCFDCCQGMGDSILLDPYDIWQFETNLNNTFAGLLQENVELRIEEGLILPCLKMQGSDERCGFLNGENRCGIHAFRPGLCRLFPLGRSYGEDGLGYFLLEDACVSPNHTKVKIKKWLGIPDLKRYEEFLVSWHTIRKGLQERIATDVGEHEELPKEINMRMLHVFYEEQYETGEFYPQYEARVRRFYMETDG